MNILRRGRLSSLLIGITVLCFYGHYSAEAKDSISFAGLIIDGVPHSDQWDIKVKAGKAQTYYSGGAFKSICLKSDSASFGLEKSINIDLIKYPVLKWKWKANKLPANGDFRQDESNDQAAQLLLVFKGWFPHESISYIWDSNATKGTTRLENWIIIKVNAVVVESGSDAIGEWRSYSKNIYNDYKKYFGGSVPKLIGIRLQINSQHTKDTAESCFGPLIFSKG